MGVGGVGAAVVGFEGRRGGDDEGVWWAGTRQGRARVCACVPGAEADRGEQSAPRVPAAGVAAFGMREIPRWVWAPAPCPCPSAGPALVLPVSGGGKSKRSVYFPWKAAVHRPRTSEVTKSGRLRA